MAENSFIEWCEHTFNPWIGCSKVSAGCKNCYAETLMDKRYGRVKWGGNGVRVKTSVANWKKPLAWNKKAKDMKVRPRVFCASLADVFEDRPEVREWRQELFELIAVTPDLEWLLLTKRPENITKFWPTEIESNWKVKGNMLSKDGVGKIEVNKEDIEFSQTNYFAQVKNVRIGTSVENQEQADKRINQLLMASMSIGAPNFLSMEPLIGPVNLRRVADGTHGNPFDCLRGHYVEWEEDCDPPPNWPVTINWVIVGGESGQGAREMSPQWPASIRNQCQTAGVPFFFKQWGAFKPRQDFGVAMDRVGKKAAGRLLQGREYNERP